MSEDSEALPAPAPDAGPHKRRPRYGGKYPRRFEDKYKERQPERYQSTVAKVLASGKTPAGMHRPIMVQEILQVLALQPGQVAVDCTLGYGGHAQELLKRLLPGGRLFGLDVDPVELPKTELRLRSLGFGPEVFTVCRSNYAGLPRILGAAGLPGADRILADLGVSSMQLDDPARGFSYKLEGPLDMRMNPQRGQPASEFLRKVLPEQLESILAENADEPRAAQLARALAGKDFKTATELAAAVRQSLPNSKERERELAVPRVFQALRIAVNEELSALESFLRELPACLNPGGRVAILSFHSGEDRRVKRAFAAGLRSGAYSGVAHEIVRPTAEECRANPRCTAAKLRWAQRA